MSWRCQSSVTFDPPVAASAPDRSEYNNGTGDFNQDGDIDGADFSGVPTWLHDERNTLNGRRRWQLAMESSTRKTWISGQPLIKPLRCSRRSPKSEGESGVRQWYVAFLDWQRNFSSQALAASDGLVAC